MGKSKASSHPQDPAAEAHGTAHGAGHGAGGAAAETEEQRQDREHSAAVQRTWSSWLKRPGAALAAAGAVASVALLATLGRPGWDLNWSWFLVSLFVFAWGLALARGADAEPAG